MWFDKNKFIEMKGQSAFILLLNFLSDEANYLKYQDFKIIGLENVRDFDYEGNVYCIKKSSNNEIEIIDEVSEENHASKLKTRFSLKPTEFLEILKESKEILSTYKDEF